MRRQFPESDKLEWWPSHVRKAFANLGRVLGHKRLRPEILSHVSRDGLPGHEIVFRHKPGKEGGRRKGTYLLAIAGPTLAGQWQLPSGQLERLAKAAASSEQRSPD